VQARFGPWLKKIRVKLLGLSQRAMAESLGLRSYVAVALLEKKDRPDMRETTRERLLDLLGLDTAEELEQMWRKGEMPDLPPAAARGRKAAWADSQGMYRAMTVYVRRDDFVRLEQAAKREGTTPERMASDMVAYCVLSDVKVPTRSGKVWKVIQADVAIMPPVPVVPTESRPLPAAPAGERQGDRGQERREQ
jgi:hypothetical protein